MVKYILSYVTKGQMGMRIIMGHAYQEAGKSMDLKTSVRQMDNVFLNGFEMSQEEDTCLALQLLIKRMSRQVLFLHTAHPDERNFLSQDHELYI